MTDPSTRIIEDFRHSLLYRINTALTELLERAEALKKLSTKVVETDTGDITTLLDIDEKLTRELRRK